MRIEHYKLVRDSIPDIINQNGYTCSVATMDEEEYRQALRDKLIEEAREAAETSTEKLVTELADVYEVIDALIASYNIKDEDVHFEQERKRAVRGGFEGRIRLLWIEQEDE